MAVTHFAFFAYHPAWIVAGVFGFLAFAAAAVVAWPAWKARGAAPLARALLSAALVLFVLGIGIGSYLLLGTPELAQRALAAPEIAGVPGLIAKLSRRMRDRPNDVMGWTLLGRGYLSLNDPAQAAIAFRQASVLAPPGEKPELLSSYGEALTLAAGSVTPEAEAAFQAALSGRPHDFSARFYLGEAYAEQRQPARALALWKSLLADAPANAPWRAELIDRIAALQAEAGPRPDIEGPDIEGMVAGLAAQLKAQPDDLSGWERLVRAYVVLGKDAAARAALVRAEEAMQGRPGDMAALETEAKSLRLQR
jgi:cytochrome c-type biogenesis protein CcmH